MLDLRDGGCVCVCVCVSNHVLSLDIRVVGVMYARLKGSNL